MRILHVASAFTPDNRFGGPTRVAVGLAAEQQRRGHDVLLVGAGLDWPALPDRIDGVPARLVGAFNPVPPLGWASVVAPRLGRVLRQELPKADVVHVHLARDLTTLRAALAARRAGRPYVVQTHGMVDEADGALARLVDGAATGRALLGAGVALTLTPAERVVVDRLSAGRTRAVDLPNGVDGPPAASTASGVLFLARLHPRKGAVAFVQAAAAVAERHPDVRFTVAGPDEGDGAAVRAAVDASPARDRIEVRGAVPPDEARRLLAGAAVYVLPAEGEPFGMTVIEAMGAGRPVVLHATAVLAPTIVAAGAGWTFGPGGTHGTLAEAIDAALQPGTADRAGAAAEQLVRARYSIGGVVDALQQHYEEVIAQRR